ncbi:hypothetical protein FALBO_5218 [Fusarium albosuccineum]|uniref:Uncharacterized protein n=1 Tax=Fusarium albosuccineum TaxID=1237068 RepID=A0A8H4LH70_9HYPO|nr:hypothetical protein FALBO_5218 [Fusarium albosuccineum]
MADDEVYIPITGFYENQQCPQEEWPPAEHVSDIIATAQEQVTKDSGGKPPPRVSSLPSSRGEPPDVLDLAGMAAALGAMF